MFVHVVRPGDTFWRLAWRYGVPMEAIRAANRTLDPLRLRVGTPIIIPTREPGAVRRATLHRVLPGETAWELARHYGVPLSAFLLANRLTPPYTIYPGQVLVVPVTIAH